MPARSTGWKTARASRQGTKNIRRNQPCQDHSVWAALPIAGSHTLVAAVADGLGSADMADRGARIATNVAVHEASLLMWQQQDALDPQRIETILTHAVLKARQRIQHVATRECVAPSRLATTLLLAVHINDTIATAQVGDGAAVVSVHQDRYMTFSKPERGEYANETTSITSPRFLQNCRIDIATSKTPVEAIALMTDGMVSLTLATTDDQPHEPFFQMMTQWLRDHDGPDHPNQYLADLLQSQKITKRTDDDTTLLLAVRT